MRWFNERRGQKVRENDRLRLGEIRFVPADTADQTRAEMSEGTWQLIQGDEARGRAYVTARARAMRQDSVSTMNIIGKATATDGTLDELESLLSGLLDAIRALNDPSEFASADLLRRRQSAKAALLLIEDRVATCRTRLDVVDELVNAKLVA